MRGLFLHGNTNTIGEVFSRSANGSRSSEGDLGSNLTDQAGTDNAVTAELGLDGSSFRILEGSSNGDNIAWFGRGMGSLGCEGECRSNLVEEANVELRELGCGSDRGKDRTTRVRSSQVEGSNTSLSGEAIGQIASNLHAGRQSGAKGGADLGHVLNIKDTGGKDVSVGVVDAYISSLVSLEGHSDTRRNFEGGLQYVSTIGLDLNLVEGQTSVAELGADLGRESTSGTSLGLDCYGNWTSILLALEGDTASVVVAQKVCIFNSGH